MPLYTTLEHLLNILVQIANKARFCKRKMFPVLFMGRDNIERNPFKFPSGLAGHVFTFFL
jgi:hypothetical protein